MEYIQVKDIQIPELEVFTRASEVQLLRYFEPDTGVFVAESANVILRALEAGYEPLSLLVETQRLEAEGRPVIDLIEKLFPGESSANMSGHTGSGIKVYIADHDLVKELTGYSLVRGLWALMRRKPLKELPEFCEDKQKLAVLYDIVNPTNVGAIIRSAAALGIDGVILTNGSVNPLSRRASRVSMGTVFQVPWTMIQHDMESAPIKHSGAGLIDLLHTLGFQTVAMALTDDSVSVDDEILKGIKRLAVILGTEGDGLPQDIIDRCTYTVKIPMAHGVDSLNVAAASAVAFWEILGSRGSTR